MNQKLSGDVRTRQALTLEDILQTGGSEFSHEIKELDSCRFSACLLTLFTTGKKKKPVWDVLCFILDKHTCINHWISIF